jgi:hypothetical protein
MCRRYTSMLCATGLVLQERYRRAAEDWGKHGAILAEDYAALERTHNRALFVFINHKQFCKACREAPATVASDEK